MLLDIRSGFTPIGRLEIVGVRNVHLTPFSVSTMVDRQFLALALPLPEHGRLLALRYGYQRDTHRYPAKVALPPAPKSSGAGV